jgi:molybdopterin/thiamine biosynthesis adenylyltransferase
MGVEVVACPRGLAVPGDFAPHGVPAPSGAIDLLGAGLGLGEVVRLMGGVKIGPGERPLHLRFGTAAVRSDVRRVLIFGTGNLGCNIALALLSSIGGPLDVFLLDRPGQPGAFEERNLSSTPLARPEVIGQSKTEVAARELIARSGGALRATPIHATVTSPSDARGILREVRPDLVFRAMDSHFSSWALHEAALSERVPLIYGALSKSAGTVRVVQPGGAACLNCAHTRLSAKLARPASAAPADSSGAGASCADRPANVGQVGAVIASLMVLEAMRRAPERLRGSLFYDLEAEERLSVLTTPGDAGCAHTRS